MILTAVFVMLSNLEEWNPVDLYRVDMPEHLKEKQLAKAVKQAVRFLETQGLTVLDAILPFGPENFQVDRAGFVRSFLSALIRYLLSHYPSFISSAYHDTMLPVCSYLSVYPISRGK